MAERVSTAVRLNEDVHARLQREAERRDVSVNWLVGHAVERALVGWEAQELDRVLDDYSRGWQDAMRQEHPPEAVR